MRDITIWKKITNAIVGVIYALFGILMIKSPVTTLASLSLLMGWVVAILGIFVIVVTVRLRHLTGTTTSYIDGFLLLILGLMFLFGNFISNTLFLAYLLIFWIITDSIFQLQFVAVFAMGWIKYLTMFIDILIIIFSLYLLFNPIAAESFLVFSIGFTFIATGFTKVIKAM